MNLVDICSLPVITYLIKRTRSVGLLEYILARLYCICSGIYTSMFNEHLYTGFVYSGHPEKGRYAQSFQDQ